MRFLLLCARYGEVKVTLANASQQQGHTLYHVAGELCYGAIARTSVSWAGRWRLAGPQRGYVTIFSPQGEDILTASRLYIKSELPGLLTFSGRSPRPQSVHLVERLPTEDRVLETVDYTTSGDTALVRIEPTQQAYWIRLEW